MSSGLLPEALPDARRSLQASGLLFLVAVLLLFVAVVFPAVVGADHSYVVRSDSMSPAIDAGAVVFVTESPAKAVAEDDIITFEEPGERRVTHRVVEVIDGDDGRRFRTKGDANEEPDPTLVTPSQIIGTVGFSIPLLGYVIDFAGTDIGTISLVIVPALLLIVLEIRDFLAAGAESEEETDE